MPSDGRVLVVDPAAGDIAAALERSLSVTTVTAADPDRALSTLDDRRVDCVVTELRFGPESEDADASDTVDVGPSDTVDPGPPETADDEQSDEPRSSRNGPLAGVALLDALRERDPTLPVVVYTAVGPDDDNLDPAALAGATARVEKTGEGAGATLAEWVERCVAARTDRRDRLAGVVHDLRNPLRAANVSLARLRRDADLDDDQVADLAATHERLGDLLDDLDALVDAGRPVTDADTESVALDAVAREAWRTVDTRGATLRVETESTVDADPRRLRRLFENLFANAVEHGSNGGESTGEDDLGATDPTTDLTVTVGDSAEGFFVADDGTGIPEREREVVFERGYSTVDGTGYGLAIVAELAAAHGWSVAATGSESGGARIEVSH
jgi:signal transduction histidine kinase